MGRLCRKILDVCTLGTTRRLRTESANSSKIAEWYKKRTMDLHTRLLFIYIKTGLRQPMDFLGEGTEAVINERLDELLKAEHSLNKIKESLTIKEATDDWD